MEKYVAILKALVEGDMDLAAWQEWWAANAHAIEPKVSRLCFLRLKHQPYPQAQEILKEFGIVCHPYKSKCPVCGERLFQVIPGITTKGDISAFAGRATFPGAEQIEQIGWIHPGQYCPTGCTDMYFNYADPGMDDLGKKWEAEFESTHTCRVTVQGDTTLPQPLSDYNVYIDGYIIGTRQKDISPPNGELVWLRPGEHRIIVREIEVQKVNRLESNTLWFTASEDTVLHFEVGMTQGHLKLTQR